MLLAIVMLPAMHVGLFAQRFAILGPRPPRTVHRMFFPHFEIIGVASLFCSSQAQAKLRFLRFIFGVTLMQLAYAHLQTNDADTAEVTKYYGTLGSVSAR